MTCTQRTHCATRKVGSSDSQEPRSESNMRLDSAPIKPTWEQVVPARLCNESYVQSTQARYKPIVSPTMNPTRQRDPTAPAQPSNSLISSIRCIFLSSSLIMPNEPALCRHRPQVSHRTHRTTNDPYIPPADNQRNQKRGEGEGRKHT